MIAGIAFYSFTVLNHNGPSSIYTVFASNFLLNVAIGAVLAGAHVILTAHVMEIKWGSMVPVSFRIPALVISASMTIALAYSWYSAKAPLLLVALAGFITFTMLTASNAWPLSHTFTAPKVKPLSEDWSTAFVSRHSRLRRIAEARSKQFKLYLLKSGLIGNPYIISAKSLSLTVSSFVVVFPLSISLALLTNPGWLLLLALPLVIFMQPVVSLRDRADVRKSGCEKELPFFAIFASILNDVGMSLDESFESVIERRVFPNLEKEARLLVRNIRVLGMYPVQALEMVSRNHPSRLFASFLNGYTSKARSGGDISLYFRSKGEELLRSMGLRWENYGERVGDLGSVSLGVIVILPLLVLVVSVFLSSNSLTMMYVFTFMVLPAFTIVIYFMTTRLQPKIYDRTEGNLRASLPLSLVGGTLSISGQLWLGIASTIFLFSVIYGFSVLKQRREIREEEDALVPFLTDITEYKKQEYDINKAMINASKENHYNGRFDAILGDLAAQLSLNRPLKEVEISPRSWLAMVVFSILQEAGTTGGGTPETFEVLTSYVSKVLEAKTKATMAMRPFLLISYLAPVFLAFGTSFAANVLTSFAVSLGPVAANLPSFIGANIRQAPVELVQLADIFVVLASASLGLLAAKAVDYTVKNTLRISTNVLLAIIATLVFSTFNLLPLIRF